MSSQTTGHAVLLGGLANTTSAARSLGRDGVHVTIIADRKSPALKTRFAAKKIPINENQSESDVYREWLLEGEHFPEGTVIFPCVDEAIYFVAKHKELLKKRYILDIQNPQHQIDLLDKQRTLDMATETGCSSPGFWNIDSWQDIENCADDIVFPVLIKPIHSHIFQQEFACKLFYIEDLEHLREKARLVMDADIEFMICEFIPGSDSQISSYYVYIDEQGERLFEYTKRVLRRSPPNFGAGCFHICEWIPETAEMGYRFFKGIGFKGLGNIEFKTDPRSGELKVIECNIRFTGAQDLVTKSGIDMPQIIFRYLTRGERPGKTSFTDFLTLWLPFEDFDSFRELRAAGELTFTQWIKSVFRFHTISYFDWTDPLPFIVDSRDHIFERIGFIINKFR